MSPMRAYSTDLQERLVRAVADDQPMREAARRFDVAVTTVKRAVVQERETGLLERKPIPGCPLRIRAKQEAALQTQLEAAPDATVLEHYAWWAEHYGQQLSESAMWRAIRRLGWTHKKVAGSQRARRGGAHSLARGRCPARPGAVGLCRRKRQTRPRAALPLPPRSPARTWTPPAHSGTTDACVHGRKHTMRRTVALLPRCPLANNYGPGHSGVTCCRCGGAIAPHRTGG
jgi:transposase